MDMIMELATSGEAIGVKHCDQRQPNNVLPAGTVLIKPIATSSKKKSLSLPYIYFFGSIIIASIL